MAKRQKKILIYRLGSLGDTVVVLPCFHKIRETYPDAEITLLTNKPIASKAAPLESILGDNYFFDRVLAYPVGTRSPFILLSLLLRIRLLNIDTLVNIAAVRSEKAAKRDRLFFKAAGVKHMVGFPTSKEDFKPIVDPVTNEYEWEAARIARRIRSLGNIDLNNSKYWDLKLTNEETALADELLQNKSGKNIAISAGTKMQAKDWGVENWVKLIKELKQLFPTWRLIMIGAPDEVEISEKCLIAWGDNGINLCGKTSPRVSGAILKKSKIFIGHDSGPMHLAASVGTACVAIFSARNIPRQWYPRGDNNKIIYHRTDCAGCGLEVCVEQQKKCIMSITVHEVLTAVVSIIKPVTLISDK